MTFRKLLFNAMVYGLWTMVLFSSCKKDEDDAGNPLDNLDAMPFEKLSEYNFFSGEMKNQNPNAGIIPYDLNTPLFSDFAGKARFVYVPEGKQAVYNATTYLDFPVGTIIIKTFYFSNDLRDASLGRKIYETRLMVHKAGGWEAYLYLWNDIQTEAEYYVAGKNVNVSWVHYDGSTRSTLYHIPNKNECKGCHNDSETIIPLGPKARNLNKDYAYSSGVMNQLEKWKSLGILSGAPDASAAPRVPVWNDPNSGSLNDRARAYLDVNCAHCHSAHGPANSSGLMLDYDQTDPTALGICKSPVAAGQGSGGRKYSIVPGQPENSIMTYRMNSNVTDIAMPELARSVIHDEGVQLISDWITSLPPAGCE
jgi:uncharacterized repeat protein (TIGR03806 family)